MIKEKFDIIELGKFKAMAENEQFINKYFTINEIRNYPVKNAYRSLAGRFIIKKCIIDKILISNINYRYIEILNNDLGKPVLKTHKEIQKKLKDINIKSIDCSISHSRNYATGYVVYQLSNNETCV